MDYCLGNPDGSATMWTAAPTSDADGDGLLDAIGLDLDHDGLIDDLLADLDGDDLADHGLLNGLLDGLHDLDGDGTREATVTDDGSGTWAVGADRGAALRWLGLDGVEHPATALAVDLDGDGDAGERLVDVDGDGLADRAVGPAAAWVDTDGDGRWDVRLRDGDGDGRADGADRLA